MASARFSATAARASTIAAMPIGTLIRNTQRQLRTSVSTPPISVPTAPPRPFIAPHSAIARKRSGPGGKVEVMIASDAAAMPAPARPCAARAPISTVLSGAMPATSDAAVNAASATMNVRRCPNRSHARPASIRKPAKTIA